MLKLQFASDLHFERREGKQLLMIKPVGDILILAGDIATVDDPLELAKLREFLTIYSKHFMYIFHVAGNHEFWSTSSAKSAHPMSKIHAILKRLGKEFLNYRYLDRDTVSFIFKKKKYTIIGASLWTNIPKEDYKNIKSKMNDYNYIWIKKADTIRKLLPEDTTRLHHLHTSYINKMIQQHSKDNIILITHHKPTNDLNQGVAYETDMTTNFLKPPIKLAIHGHTHVLYDKIINGVRVVSNPRGYYPSNTTGYRNSWVISI